MPLRSLATAFVLLLCAAAPAGASTRIALLPISVHASGAEVGYLQSGLMEMLASRLDQYQDLVVIRPGGDAVPAKDDDAAREAGRAAGAEYVLFGSFTRFGDGASLDLRCAAVGAPADDDARDETRRVFIQSGNLAEIIPQLDTLAQKVARYAVTNGGAAPRLVGDTGQAASAGEGDAGYEELRRRVEALERALYAPVASGKDAEQQAPEADAEPSAVR